MSCYKALTTRPLPERQRFSVAWSVSPPRHSIWLVALAAGRSVSAQWTEKRGFEKADSLYILTCVKRGLKLVSVIATSSRMILKLAARFWRSLAIAIETFQKSLKSDKLQRCHHLVTLSEKLSGGVLGNDGLQRLMSQ